MASEIWPDFLIIGAAKAGTTSLYRALCSHPEVGMARVKEPRYFAFAETGPDPEDPIMRDSVCDAETYLSLFPDSAGQSVRGEASPIYLTSDAACRAIHAKRPDMRLIVILRDPADRAFSHFLMSQRQGYERESRFVAALREPVVQLGRWQRVRPYIPYSRYGEGLARYLDRFPRQQLLVLFTSDLETQPGATLERLSDFLGIAPFPAMDAPRANVGHAVRSPVLARLMQASGKAGLRMLVPDSLRKPIRTAISRANTTERRMTVEERAAALAHLDDDIRRCEDLLGCDLVAWRTGDL